METVVKRGKRSSALALAAGVAIALAACGGGPRQLLGLQSDLQTYAECRVGQRIYPTAYAVYSDGSTEAVQATAQWVSLEPSVLSVELVQAGGRWRWEGRCLAAGSVGLSATHHDLSLWMTVTVSP